MWGKRDEGGGRRRSSQSSPYSRIYVHLHASHTYMYHTYHTPSYHHPTFCRLLYVVIFSYERESSEIHQYPLHFGPTSPVHVPRFQTLPTPILVMTLPLTPSPHSLPSFPSPLPPFPSPLPSLLLTVLSPSASMNVNVEVGWVELQEPLPLCHCIKCHMTSHDAAHITHTHTRG